MRQRLVRSLLVLTLLSSGTSAPFAHVHPPGHDHGGAATSVESAGERGARRDWHGVHWHQGERRAPGTSGPDIGERVSVALEAAAETAPVRSDTTPAPAEALPSAALSNPASRTAPAAACADPDPPPRARRSTRAPPLPR